MFKNGQVIDLGTLPGGHESFGQDINDRGQVTGFASNGTPDPFSPILRPGARPGTRRCVHRGRTA